ncbi:MAG TPA: tetratricopeptide repeat protein [Treponemataceae bacterium]|nr:tetratricopeptide repeat protein [Treponemataceae bacterium]
MFKLIKRLFSGTSEEPIDVDAIPQELWQTNFKNVRLSRFEPETEEFYSSHIGSKGLTLELTKKNLYAWTVNPVYRYRDFVLETVIEFSALHSELTSISTPIKKILPENLISEGSTKAGTVAAGCIFRYLNEGTFYSVLVSDGGMVRMDCVLNGNPIPVLGWTEINPGSFNPEDSKQAPYVENTHKISLQIISRGTSFTIIVNDSWVAECQDEGIQAAGRIAFAAQNWNQRTEATFSYNAIALDSRPMEVETLYARWNHYIKIQPEARINLARTWYAMGKYVPAILELKKAWKNKEPSTEETLLSAQIYLAQRLLPEAEEQIRKIIDCPETQETAIAELGGILYLQNRFVELENLLLSLDEKIISNSSFLSNLEGHLLHWKGNHEKAALAYSRAGKLNSEQGLFHYHAGNEWAYCGNENEAIEEWIEAARIFLNTGEEEDLEPLLKTLLEKKPKDIRIQSLFGKYEYSQGRSEQALEALTYAIENETTDSAVWYLTGMLNAEKENFPKAIVLLRKACELEETYGPYRFRLAETLFFAGEDCSNELNLALQTDPDNPWIHNLATLDALEKEDLERAEFHSTRALQLLPDNNTLRINFAELRRKQGLLTDVLPLLDGEEAELLHAGANLLVEDSKHEEAEEWYKKALHKSPFDPEILTDRAANCIELDLLNEADDLLGRALNIGPSARIYQLLCYLAARKGEYSRAEVALQQGMTEFPEDTNLVQELARLYTHTNRSEKAFTVIENLKKRGNFKQIQELETEIMEQSTNKIDCAVCDRSWRVPKNIPAQGSLHLTAEPPDTVPAGTCPSCHIHYCIGCAKKTLGADNRFRCPTCGSPLKLIEQDIIWLLNRWQAEQQKQD